MLTNTKEKVQKLVDFIEMMSSNKKARENMVNSIITGKDIVNIDDLKPFTEDSTTREILFAYLTTKGFELIFEDGRSSKDM